MKLYNNNPNFSIFLTGSCNAKCSFCFNNDKTPKSSSDYLYNLDYVLSNLEDSFKQISLTGFEPLLSPDFNNVISLLRSYKTKFPKIVLTTNGTSLSNKLPLMENVVDHINISRHHYDPVLNNTIFGGSYSKSEEETLKDIDLAGAYGIDISFSCVITNSTTKDFIQKYIDKAKYYGVNTIQFRKVAGSLDLPKVFNSFNDYKIISESSCPVCSTVEQRIKGMPVLWKQSLIEPTETLKEIYELVFMPSGKLYADWSEKHEVDLIERPTGEALQSFRTLNTYSNIPLYSACSSGSRLNTYCGRPSSSSCSSGGC